MDENMELQNHLLVAMPSLRDPNFAGTVVYITGHDEKGSRGFVINRQTELMLSDVLEQSKVIAKGSPRLPDRVFIGGPVDPQRGFLLHEKAGEYAASREISPTLCVTLSADVLSRMWGRTQTPPFPAGSRRMAPRAARGGDRDWQLDHCTRDGGDPFRCAA